jgi:hypothetical protein
VELIVRRPNPNQEEAPRTSLTFRRFASGYDFSTQLGIFARYELEERRKQFHNNSLVSGQNHETPASISSVVSASLTKRRFAVTTSFEGFYAQYQLQMNFDAQVSYHLERREKIWRSFRVRTWRSFGKED